MNLKRRDARPVAKTASNGQPGSPSGNMGGSGPKFVLITHPDASSDLQSDTTIINALQYAGVRGGDNPLFTGQMFDWLGCRILETSNCAFVSGGGLSLAAAVHICQTIVFGEGFYGETEFTQDAMEIKVKPIGSAGALDPLDQFGTVGWKAAKAFVVLNQSFGQRIEHATANNSMPVNP